MVNLANDDKITRKNFLDLEERLIKKLVSKEEFEQKTAGLATTKELSNIRTELLEKLATREAVDVLANQVAKNTVDIADIKTEIKTINHKMVLMQDRIEKIDDKIDKIDVKFDKKFDTILNAVDTVLKEVTNNRTEKAAIDHALIRHDNRFDDREKRIRKLERKAV